MGKTSFHLAILALVLTAVAEAAGPLPSKLPCGRYLAKGILQEGPRRLLIQGGTASERILRVAGECRACPHLEGLPVEAEFTVSSPGGEAQIATIRASAGALSPGLAEGLRQLKAQECSPASTTSRIIDK